MAGAPAEAMPLLCAAVEAMADPAVSPLRVLERMTGRRLA